MKPDAKPQPPFDALEAGLPVRKTQQAPTQPRRRASVTAFALWEDKADTGKTHKGSVFVIDRLAEKVADRLPFLRRLSVMNGTMPEIAQVCMQWRVSRWADATLRGAGQVVFASNPISGLLILAALFGAVGDGGAPAVAVGGVLGLVSATATAIFLQLDNNAIQSGRGSAGLDR